MSTGAVRSVLLAGALLVGTAISPAPAAAQTPHEKFVTRVYDDFFLRPPTPAELTLGTAILGGGTSRASYLTSLFQSPPWRTLWIRGVYATYLAREPTSSELGAADAALTSSWNHLATEADVVGATPYFQLAGATNLEFVQALYLDILHRDPDAGGWTYWTGQLDSGAKTRRQVAVSFLRNSESAGIRVRGLAGETECLTTTLEFIDDMVAGSYCLTLDRMADPSGAAYWINQLTASGQLPSLWVSHASSNEYWNLTQT